MRKLVSGICYIIIFCLVFVWGLNYSEFYKKPEIKSKPKSVQIEEQTDDDYNRASLDTNKESKSTRFVFGDGDTLLDLQEGMRRAVAGDTNVYFWAPNVMVARFRPPNGDSGYVYDNRNWHYNGYRRDSTRLIDSLKKLYKR